MPKYVLGVRENKHIFRVEFYVDTEEKAYKMRYLYFVSTGIVLDVERWNNDGTSL